MERELAQVDNHLKELNSEQEKLLQLALKDFPEDIIQQENTKINTSREELKKRRAELEAKMEKAKQSELCIDSIKKACAMVNSNIADLSFANKRLALEALDIRVLLDGENVTLTGYLPMINFCAVSTLSP